MTGHKIVPMDMDAFCASSTISASSNTTASNTAMAMATCCCWFVAEIGGCLHRYNHDVAATYVAVAMAVTAVGAPRLTLRSFPEQTSHKHCLPVIPNSSVFCNTA